jgi:hypothetical protein
MKMTLKQARGFTALSQFMAAVLLGLLGGCSSRPPIAARLHRLQGSWEGVLVGREQDGKIALTITGNSLHLHRDTNFWFETTFTLPAGAGPQQLYATVKSSAPSQGSSIGAVVPAIFQTGDRNLTLALNQDHNHAPPKGFDDDTPGVIHYEFWRAQKRNPEVSTANATNQPPQTIDTAKAREHGRKHPAEIAKTVSGPDLLASPIAFQNNSAGVRKVYWLDTIGERQLFRELKPGESYELETYLNHAWVITDADGNALSLFYPDGQKRTVTLE